ncbi:MAG TPA: hypothetical protein VF531_07920 [Bacillota bacterium]
MKKLIIFLILVAVLAAVGYWLQISYQIFDAPLAMVHEYLSRANQVYNGKLGAGITVGTVILIGVLLAAPFFTRKINTSMYFSNLKQGIISSFIFLLSQTIFNYFNKFGSFYLLLAMLGVAIITLVLVRMAVRLFKNEKEGVEFRTSFISSVAAGLIFGVLLNLGVVLVDLAKGKAAFLQATFFK